MPRTKLIHAEAPNGKVHYATEGVYAEDYVDPYCNHRTWIGDYWGKRWKKTDKPVTCKNCLSAYAKEHGKRWPPKQFTVACKLEKGEIIKQTTLTDILESEGMIECVDFFVHNPDLNTYKVLKNFKITTEEGG